MNRTRSIRAPASVTAGLRRRLRPFLPDGRARAAARRLGTVTVGDFLLAPRAAFVAALGDDERLYERIENGIAAWLAQPKPRAGDARLPDACRPIRPLVDDERALRACLALGITDAAQFLTTQKSRFLACCGGSEDVWRVVYDRVRSEAGSSYVPAASLPRVLLDTALDGLDLPPSALSTLQRLGCTRLGHCLTLPPAAWRRLGTTGQQARRAVREQLGNWCRLALAAGARAPSLEPGDDWRTLQDRLLGGLDEPTRTLVSALVGIDTEPVPLATLAMRRGVDMATMRAACASARAAFRLHAAPILGRLRRELGEELAARDGAVTAADCGPTTWIGILGKASGDAMLPLRLLAFAHASEYTLVKGAMTTVPRARLGAVRRQIRLATRPASLPVAIDDIAERLRPLADVPRGLLLHLLRTGGEVEVRIDPQRGELAVPHRQSLGGRLRALFAEQSTPFTFPELVYAWRERHRHVQPGRLASHLAVDPGFVRLDAERWDLRHRHAAALQALAPLAERVAEHVVGTGGRQRLDAVLAAVGASDADPWLLRDCLRRCARVRWLGRGELCPVTQARSRVLDDLLADFRRAGSDVVHSRFLANQPSERQRLVARLLRENRLFLMPEPDRIDVLTNYPLNPERMQSLLATVDRLLVRGTGYAPLAQCLLEVDREGLGGLWLNEGLLGELLRRHGSFELLPGGIVARRALGLGGWMMQRARAALRAAGTPITLAEILAVHPELAEFADCVRELLHKDPMVQSPDGGARFALV